MNQANRTIEFLPPSPQAAREIRRNSPRRRARTCYDHLAGVAGVTLMDVLLERGWLEEAGQSRGRTHFRLTDTGQQALSERGVTLPEPNGSKRMYAYGCVDWTERRFHLGGALGAAVLASLVDGGAVHRDAGTRVVAMLEPFHSWTGLE